jgi:uncharacterized membrane protein YcaP (DUF421 family)
MRKELLTEDELMSQLRQQDIYDLAEVKVARVEPDGEITVERIDGQKPKKKPKRESAVR